MERAYKNSLKLPTVVFLVFLILKLTNNIDWSWIWVTCPLWITFTVALSIIIIAFFIVIIALIIGFSTTDIIEKAENYINKSKEKLGKSN